MPSSTIPPRCDNCFFSLYINGHCRSVLTCKAQAGFAPTQRIVALADSCPNFHPSPLSKLGRSAIRPIPLTQGKFAIVDAADYYNLTQFQWYAKHDANTFYASRNHAGKSLKMHRQIMSAPAHLLVDHIDHDGLNNTRANLRLCTFSQNSYNTGSTRGSTSRYKGICWRKKEKKWVAKIHSNNKTYHIGYFTDEIEAAKAYDEKAKKLHGQFACLNFPPSE